MEEKKLEEFVDKTEKDYPSKFCISDQSTPLLIILYNGTDLDILTVLSFDFFNAFCN